MIVNRSAVKGWRENWNEEGIFFDFINFSQERKKKKKRWLINKLLAWASVCFLLD
jgi:hypothetical protein